MCGIIGYVGQRDVVPILVDGLKKLEYRGYDSAGIAVVDENQIHLRRVKGKISDLVKNLKSSAPDGSFGVGHTRWATHGRPSEENAHPHRDCTDSLVVVHNGIIENYLALKKKLIKEKHTFRTETDTEVIAHLVEKYFHGSLEEAVQKAVQEIEGAFAIAAISLQDPGKIVVAKIGPPAVVGLGEGEFFVSSDLNPLLSYTQRVVFLEDGEIAVLDSQGAKFLSFQGKPLKKKEDLITWSPLMVEKRGFKHFMLKEIFEQPQVVRDTLKGRISLDSGKVFLEEIGIPTQALTKITKVVIIACGTSYHAGLVTKNFIETLVRIPVDVEFASEYRYRDFILDKNTLAVVISQSGETADSLAALRAVKKCGALTLAVCNVVKSSIAREADGVLYTYAGPEIGVAATKTFSAQMAALALLALYLGQLKGITDEKGSIPLIEDLQRIPHRMEDILNQAQSIEELAQLARELQKSVAGFRLPEEHTAA